MTTTRGQCNDCEVVYINGVRCHEAGCPIAWVDHLRVCEWCGSEFMPEERYQQCCDEDCTKACSNF